MPVWNFVRKSSYHDSVTLMRLTRDMESVLGVRRAAAMMGTPANRTLLKDAGLLAAEGEDVGATDLVIAVIADDAGAADAARAAAETALARRGPTRALGAGRARPRTLASALKTLPDATLTLISVPGPYAGAEAMKALRAGLHVMLFSDNVPLDTEIALKKFAASRGLFLMGPDCGTAIIDGIPLGFANAVPRGRIGIAAASGTGLQEVSSLIAARGEGISQAIGVGGRDLSAAVGGIMMQRALAALGADPETSVMCVIGKPPEPSVARRLEMELDRIGKPCVVHFIGDASSPHGVLHRAASLEETAAAAVALARGERPSAIDFTVSPDEIAHLVTEATGRMAASQGFVRGVYVGGTLAWEAITLLRARLTDVAGDVSGRGHGHRVVDLGEDVFTVGRPHPMIDGQVRREWIEKEARDPLTAVLLLDVILGYGAHGDPAGELLPAIKSAQQTAKEAGRRLAIVASVCGTEADPQGRSAQIAALRREEVVVVPSNAQAARLAALIATRLGTTQRR